MNDPTIGDAEKVVRRVAREQYTFDENLGRTRPTTQAFKQNGKDGSVSAYLWSETTPEAVAQEGNQPYQCTVTVGVLRQNGLGIIRTPDDGGPGHCDITGHKTKRRLDPIVSAAQWVPGYAPPGAIVP